MILKLTNELDLRIGEKILALSNLSIYYTWRNIRSSHNNDKFRISAPTWNDKFELPNGSYSVWDIQNYFEYILKTHGQNTDQPAGMVYVNKIENMVTFKIKNETMKLLGSSENKIKGDKNGKNKPHLEITELVLLYRAIVNHDY